MRVVFTPLAMLMALVACDEAAPPKATLPSVPPAAAEPTEPASVAKVIDLRIVPDSATGTDQRLESSHGVTSFDPKQLSFPSSFEPHPTEHEPCHTGLPTRFCWMVRVTDMGITSGEIRAGGVIANVRVANNVFSPPALSTTIDLHVRYETGEADNSNVTVVLTLDADGLIAGSGSVRGTNSRHVAERRIRALLNNDLIVRITVVR